MAKFGYENLDGDNTSNKSQNKKLYFIVTLLLGVGVIGLVSVFANSPQAVEILHQRVPTNRTQRNQTIAISISDGRLRGQVLQSRDGREYFAFYNIPFGKPPVGNLRFEPPEEYSGTWRGTRDATQMGDRCIQKNIKANTVSGSEDCLYLTVYTPQRPRRRSSSSTKLPVMFYILGGAFTGGAASDYPGDYFMDSDIILIIPQFRVGIMGNMNTEDDIVRGNMGFKDQVMALKWVQKNIAGFGGDPKKVTIFGNSSGAMSVHAHMYSNMTKGLFYRAISQSGTALGMSAVDTNPKERAVKVGLAVGCTDQQVSNTQDLVECLKAANASAIALAQDSLMSGFTVEGRNGPFNQTFLSDTPLNLLTKGEIVSHVPYILGINSAESAPSAIDLKNSSMIDLLNNNWDQIAPTLLNLNTSLREIRDFYFGDKPINTETWREYVNMLSDRGLVHPTYLTALLYAAHSTSPVYLYRLSYEGDGNEILDEAGFERPHGVDHKGSVQYFFPFKNYPYIGADSEHANFSRILISTWATFANMSDSEFIFGNGEEWTEFNDDGAVEEIEWMELNENPKMMKVLGKRMGFWNDNFDLDELYLANVTYVV